ncbi:hypothetical protein RN001_015536 [Aquatica leii]|uniref:Amino acid transporter transmembrane domain-containing protein n=1 Tax=Aquatica leii TaxID=1421715 RepID=A0AAN7NZ62_9COLE|nr:hypothetical protein RN001_015536 [Aquatica leii]
MFAMYPTYQYGNMDTESFMSDDQQARKIIKGTCNKTNFEFQTKALISPIQENKEIEDYLTVKHPLNYVETLIHLCKANIGSGIFALGNAFKNSGILLGPILLPLLGFVCVHCQHLLINASNSMRKTLKLHKNPDFAVTAEMCFETGPIKIRSLSPYIRKSINILLCLTQLGFCCVYFIFISTNIKQIMDYYNVVYSVHLHMAFALVPILLSCVVRNLKFLTPFSILANVLIITGILITLYYCCQKPFAEVKTVGDIKNLPLFFGTALYTFEGIGLVLPLQNEMKKPKQFGTTLGVLNIGMVLLTIIFCLIGTLGYAKYGNEIKGSVTLNLPENEILAQSVKAIISLSILSTFALQFYIPVQIILPVVQERFGPFSKPLFVEIIFRIFLVLITFTLAEIIPFFELFISLIGSFGSSALALIFPPILECITKSNTSELTPWIIFKNGVILSLGIFGCATGSYESIRSIIKSFHEEQD